MKLKTLKELEWHDFNNSGIKTDLNPEIYPDEKKSTNIKELKQEAIKWVKHFYKIATESKDLDEVRQYNMMARSFEQFFNLTEEDFLDKDSEFKRFFKMGL